MANSNLKRVLARAEKLGQGEDTKIGHLAPNELVVPVDVQRSSPQLSNMLRQAFQEAGLNYDQFLVGNKQNQINENTGVPMFSTPEYSGAHDK